MPSLINIASKLGTAPITHAPPKGTDPTSPGVPPNHRGHQNAVAPSLSTNALSVPGSLDTSGLGHTEAQLRRQSLECLVAVLRSLVAWGTTNSGSINTGSLDVGSEQQLKSTAEDIRPHSVTPDPSLERISESSTTQSTRMPTPDQMADDPTKFESAKQKKTTLLEGIKKFNFSPKRVRSHSFENPELSLMAAFRELPSLSRLASFLVHRHKISPASCLRPMV